MDYTIFCTLPDGKPAFPVRILGTQTVAELKDEIKLKMKPVLDAIAAREFLLYHINLEFGESEKQEHLEEVLKIYQDLSNREPLHEWLQLLNIDGGFPKGMLHILVMLPPG